MLSRQPKKPKCPNVTRPLLGQKVPVTEPALGQIVPVTSTALGRIAPVSMQLPGANRPSNEGATGANHSSCALVTWSSAAKSRSISIFQIPDRFRALGDEGPGCLHVMTAHCQPYRQQAGGLPGKSASTRRSPPVTANPFRAQSACNQP
jgi:hypothetical protein